MGLIHAGSWVTGKNVPENRNSGIIPKRYTTASEVSLVRVTVHAVKARPVSTATGRAAMASGEVIAPNAAATARNTAEVMASFSATNSRCPWNRSAGRSGDDTAAWEV